MGKAPPPGHAPTEARAVSRHLLLAEGRMELTRSALARLRRYKYTAGGTTILDNLMNRYWWTPLSTLLPMWLAPNAITVFGTVMCCWGAAHLYVTTGATGINDPATEPTRLGYAFAAFCVFVYQTMDAIDGKQARRTGTSGPLGQLCDHGCDSIAVIMTTFMYAAGTRLSFHELLGAQLSIQGTFFCAQWEEFHTHVLRTGLPFIGVTEGQFITIGILLIDAFFGTSVWQVRLSEEYEWSTWKNVTFLFFLANTTLITLCSIVTTFYKSAERALAGFQLIPFIANMGGAICFWYHPDVTFSGILVLTMSLAFSYLSCWMIVCSMTRMEFPVYRGLGITWPLWLVYVCTMTRVFPVDHDGLFYGGYLTFVVVYFHRFITGACEEICCYLEIDAFTIPSPPPEKAD